MGCGRVKHRRGDIGLTIVPYIYRTAFRQFDMGYASSLMPFLYLMAASFVDDSRIPDVSACGIGDGLTAASLPDKTDAM